VNVRQADDVIPEKGLKVQRSPGTKFRPDIEGLRAVAVLAVVLYHADVPGIRGGFVGVDVFFVISGFLITGLLWREVSTRGTVRLRDFYGARARRLLPASAAVGIFITVAAAVLLPPLQARNIIADGIASALYVSNYRFAMQGVDYLAARLPPSPFLHYWSLGVEEQFYLVWPALILATAWLIRRTRRRSTTTATASSRAYLIVLAFVTAASFALSLVMTYWVAPVAFFSLPTRAWQLTLGGLVALTAALWQRLSPRAAAITGWTGLGLIALSCTQFSSATTYPGTAALLPTLGAALVIGAGCVNPSAGCGQILGVAPMRAIGRVSYSWYLWHWPVLFMALWAIAPVTGHKSLLALAGILLSLGLAVLTLRFIENPLRYAAPIRDSAWRSLSLGGVATAMAVVVGLALYAPDPIGPGAPAATLTVTADPLPAGSGAALYDAAVQRSFDQVRAALAEAAHLTAVPSNLEPRLTGTKPGGADESCLLSFLETRQPECASGDTDATTTVALIGDSNAAMWNPAMELSARRWHWRLETLAKAVCPVIEIPIILPTAGRPYTECEKWRTEIVDRLQAEHPRLVVLSILRRYGGGYGWDTGFTSYDPAWIDAMTRLVRRLRETGANVLVLGPIPNPGAAVPDCLAAHLDGGGVCAPTRSAAVNQAGIAAEAAATAAGGGQYVDLSDLFCTADRCPVIVGNTLVYSDQNHVTNAYARVLAPVLGSLAARAIVHP
jgi:peptidoglycan/LPS O-acetylase OafA/YrhL